MHVKFQRNRPISYQNIAIITKLTPLRLARGTCIRRHPHASTIVQYLVGGMKLPYKITACKSAKWLLRYNPRKRVTTAGLSLILRNFLRKTCSLRWLRNNVKFHCNRIWFFLSFLARYSRDRFKRPAATTQTDYNTGGIMVASSYHKWFHQKHVTARRRLAAAGV